MHAEKTQGLLIRAVDFSETSKVVTFFTRDLGKLAALAKGGRRLKSSFEVALDVLSVCDIAVIRKPNAGLDLLTEARLAERFAGFRTDLAALYAGYYVAETLDILLQGTEPLPELYDDAVAALRALSGGTASGRVLAWWHLRLLRRLGFTPSLDECGGCGRPLPAGRPLPYSAAAGGLLCEECTPRHRRTTTMTTGAVDLTRRLLEDDVAAAAAAGEGPIRQVYRVGGDHVHHLCGRRPRTAAMLQTGRRPSR